MTMDRGMNRVRVRGAGVPMNVPQDTEQPPPTNPYYPYPGERPDQPSKQASSWDPVRELAERIAGGAREAVSGFGDTGVGRFLRNASPRGPEGARERFNEDVSGLIGSYMENPYIPVVSQLLGLGKLATGSLFNDGREEGSPIVDPPFTDSGPAQEMVDAPSFDEILAQYQFDASPYDRAADYMTERRAAQMRAIQDMYNQYAAETQANVGRISDIYGGAEAGIGETYDSATQAIADAYASSQQQAADQMARLGIEEAAPAVMDPMALSQAETLSGLETNRASGLGATQRFGATAGGFASDMATVAQQQALENQRSATDQLVDQLFELEMQRAQAEQAYNPYQRAMQDIEARATYENMINPPVDDSQVYEREQDLQDRWQDYYFKNLESTASEDDAFAKTVLDAARGSMGTELQQRVLTDPQYAPFLPE